MEIIWNKSIEDKDKIEIEKFLTPYLWLIPKWSQKLYVNLYNSEDNAAIDIDVEYDYRRITMNFYSTWIIQSDESKQMHIVHELLHSSIMIVTKYAQDVFEILCPEEDNEKFHKAIFEELRVRNESATQDLAFAINQKFPRLRNTEISDKQRKILEKIKG